MIRGVLTIDQTPCRASYGLYTQAELLRRTTALQKQTVLDAIGKIAADGNRLRRFDIPGNSIPEMAAEAYSTAPPPDVVLVSIDRPIIRYTPAGGVDVRV